MTYRGKVQNGVIVLDPPATLPDGTEVKVEELTSAGSSPGAAETLSESLLKLAGRAKGLPSDAARNHDHYRYGKPKR
jgi:hypothetical protein